MMISIKPKYIIFILLIAFIAGGTFLFYQEFAQKSNVYRITIAKKSPSAELKDVFLKEDLENIFGLQKETIYNIAYDTREGSPHDKNSSPLNFSYYILIDGKPIRLKSNYENETVVVKTKIVDEKLRPYIVNSDYCEMDYDCVIRNDFCSYGAFNYYHGFYDVWGCGASTMTELECDTPNPPNECDSSNCTQEIKYKGVKCLNNKCVAEKKIGECAPWEQ